MRALFILIIMLFLHVFADYHLQGVLATLKQKSSWPQKPQDNIFRFDYKPALIEHAFEWSFVVMLPCLISIWHACTDLSWPNIRIGAIYLSLLLLNVILHEACDDLKANDKSINLTADQIFHVVQIFVTWFLWTIMIGW